MPRTFFYLMAFAIVLLESACGSSYRSINSDEGYSGLSNGDYGGPQLTESLFNSKERTLSEEDIRRILDGRIAMRDTVRLAVFQFGSNTARAWRWYDQESLDSQEHLLDTFTNALRRSPKVQKVIFLPVMVTGANPNIQQLRESAVRLQADMLLVYRLNSNIFEKYRAFKKDEAKAFATCESILMDIRTGVIPFTKIVTKSAQSVKDRADFEQSELRKRALDMATLQALFETGIQVSSFLDAPK